MEYVFEILTIHGLIIGFANSSSDFTDAPFLVKGFRSVSSSECDAALLEEFWNIVESTLRDNNITTDDFIQVLRAYRDGILLGECDDYTRE